MSAIRLVSSLLVFLSPLLGAATPYLPAATQPGAANGSVTATTFSLSNQAVSGTWELTAGAWKFKSITNHYSSKTFAPATPAELFTVALAGGTSVGSSSMTLKSGPLMENLAADFSAARFAEGLPGKKITLVYESVANNLEVIWAAELRDGSHYVRPTVTVSSLDAATITTSKITLLNILASNLTPINPIVPEGAGTNTDTKLTFGSGLATESFTQIGTVDGSPMVSDNFFLAFEHPSAQHTNATSKGQQIGTWAINKAGGSSYGPVDNEYVISSIATSGPLEITFTYTSGNHRLNINSVKLLKNGVEQDADTHFGYAGNPNNANIYSVELTNYDPAASYTIRTNTDVTEGSSNSYGSITMRSGTVESIRTSVTGDVTIAPATSSTYTSVYGCVVPGQRRRSYLCYIERERAHPYRQFLHYNSWYDVSWNVGGGSIMNESNTLASMRGHIDNFILPYNEPYDAFVFDDGWDDWNSLWNFKANEFPNQFIPMEALANAQNVKLGAWLSPFGGYGTAKNTRVVYGQNQSPPYETNGSGFSLSGPNYYAAFRDRCLQMVNDYSFSYFKFDGIGAGNGASGAGSQFFADIEAMRRLTKELRTAQNDLFINLTVGSWPSTFWLWSADSIWRAGEDMGFTGEGNDHERWITYRDNETYKNIVQRAPLFPLNSLMTHGIDWANNGHANNSDFNSASFKSDIRAYFGGGTNLQELYLSPGKLSAADWKNLAECIKWSRENADTLDDNHWIAGNPGTNAIYGWAAWQPDKGILTLRNPSSISKNITLTLADVFELPAGAASTYYLKSPWIEDATDTANAQDAKTSFVITLQPYQVLNLEATTAPPATWHANSAYREWAMKRPSNHRYPSAAFGENKASNQLAFALGIDASDTAANVSGTYQLQTAPASPGGVNFQYTRSADLGTATLVVEISTDLTHWYSGSGHIHTINDKTNPDGTRQITVTADDSYTIADRIFYRLHSVQ